MKPRRVWVDPTKKWKQIIGWQRWWANRQRKSLYRYTCKFKNDLPL